MSKKVISNLIWRFAERSGAQIVQFIVQIILARLIEPEAFGTISIVLVFTNILQVFIDSGIGTALIQNKDSDELDFSSVFYFNIVWCWILYLVAYIAAPFIAAFYEDTQLIPIIRVLSLILPISGIKNVEQAYVSKTLQFKKFFFSTLAGMTISAVAGIWSAFNGFGVWALVIQKLVNVAVDTIVQFFTVGWRPKLMFSISRIKIAFSFAWKVLLTQLIDFIYIDFEQLVIGKIYSPSILAYYSRGKQFPQIIVQNVNTSIDSVLFPVMSARQDNTKNVKLILQRSIKTSTYVMAPLMIGLFVISPTLVPVLLTDSWLSCVPFLKVFCITYLFMPIHTSNMNAIKALGRSDVLLKNEVIKKIVCFTVLIVTMFISVDAILYGLLVCTFFTQILNAWPNRKLLGYGYIEQMKDIMPGICSAIFMGVCVWVISFFNLSSIVLLILQILVGGLLYIVISEIFKLDAYLYLKQIVGRFVKTLTSRKLIE